MRGEGLCGQTRSCLKSWRNLSALGSPRLWAITAFTEKVQIEKAIFKRGEVYQHKHQCCRGKSRGEMLDQGGLAGRRIWVEKMPRREGWEYPTTCNERRRALGHFQDCEPFLAALCWRTRAWRQCLPSPRTSRRRTCPVSRGFARSSSPTRPVPWFNRKFPSPAHHSKKYLSLVSQSSRFTSNSWPAPRSGNGF